MMIILLLSIGNRNEQCCRIQRGLSGHLVVTRRIVSTSTRSGGQQLLFGKFVVEHPVHAKAVGKHSEAGAPECVLQRHGDFAVLAQGGKELLDLLQAFAGNGDREIIDAS